jgi:hypothetical protein
MATAFDSILHDLLGRLHTFGWEFVDGRACV